MMIALRKAHPALRQAQHLTERPLHGGVYADITWHGTRAWHADWSPGSRTIAFMLTPPASDGGAIDDFIYVALNSHWETLPFELPALAPNRAWHVAANSGAPSPDDIHPVGAEPRLLDQEQIHVGGRSAIVLVGR